MFGKKPAPAPVAAPQSEFLVNAIAYTLLASACAAVVIASLETLKKSPTTSLSQARILQAMGFAINIASVIVPGRFDSDVEPGAALASQFPWPTLFSPAPFAFAIWGAIYLGEIIGMGMIAYDERVATRASNGGVAWVCANVCQALWCASFRKWALSKLWLSTACLGATAACLYLSQTAHEARCRFLNVPRSMHLGWVTAATLVNLNAWVGVESLGAPSALCVAISSVVVAVVVAFAYLRSELPCASMAVAWGLFALSKGDHVGPDAFALGTNALEGLARSEGVAAALIAAGTALHAVGVFKWPALSAKEATVKP